MTGSNWRDHLDLVQRDGDHEQIGYLRSAGAGGHEPLNLLGIAVGEIADHNQAIETVRSRAMASLSEPWWVRIPRPLTEPLLNARSVGEDIDWDRVVVAELTPDRALMRPMYAWPEEAGCYLAVDLPAVDIVFENEPVDAI